MNIFFFAFDEVYADAKSTKYSSSPQASCRFLLLLGQQEGAERSGRRRWHRRDGQRLVGRRGGGGARPTDERGDGRVRLQEVHHARDEQVAHKVAQLRLKDRQVTPTGLTSFWKFGPFSRWRSLGGKFENSNGAIRWN